ncbi:MAG: hypothetical protein ACRDGD_04785 [Candidatus Limnocylindria bacterium]
MSDTAIGFLLVGIGILVVLGIVFAIASRGGPAGDEAAPAGPPRGVHLPSPSFLPVVLSAAAALLAAGLAFRTDDQLANPILGIGGLVVLVLGIIAWVRAANHEWHDTEQGAHDDGAGH